MGKKNQRYGRVPVPARTDPKPATSGFESGARQVGELIAGNHSKAAVEIAKDLHKRYATAESEMLLFGAYEFRIRELLKQGMPVEAKALLHLVSTRFPSARNRLKEIEWDVHAGAGDLAELVAPLRDPHLAPEIREKIETAIRQRVDDLSGLAQASSLPPTHPLREAAGALAKALQAVTSGPVAEDILRLPEVSRRSPLASWKALVRAIHSFYHGQPECSRKWLEAIAPDSVPGRLVEPMQALLGHARGTVLSPAAMSLVRSVGSNRRTLQAGFASLEADLQKGTLKAALDHARDAISLCRQCHPELVEKLRQHIIVRAMLRDFRAGPVLDAVGKVKEDAYGSRLMARGFEEFGNAFEARIQAVECWELFRQEAIREKWFAANSLEDGLVSLRVARLVSRLPIEMVEDLLEDAPRAPRRPGADGALPSAALLDAGNLFARACRADPHPEVFTEWLAWAKEQKHDRDADEVAERWHRTRPEDVAPLLWLVKSAERRGAYQKSLKFLEQAELLDQVNPEVRKVRLRLLTAGVLRHLRQRKPHLAANGIERMAATPEGEEGKLGPAIAALRRVCSALDGAGATADGVAFETHLGDGVFVLLKGIAEEAGLTLAEAGVPAAGALCMTGSKNLAALAQACALGELLGIPSALPESWEAGLSAALTTLPHALDGAQLLVIGEAALRGQRPKLAYQVSAAGMAARTADARFLFLRGRALPARPNERSLCCLRAALELARRDREMELAGRVLDLLQSKAFAGLARPDTKDERFPPEMLQRVLDEERANNLYPDAGQTPASVQMGKTEQNLHKRHRGRYRFDTDEEEGEMDGLAKLLEDAPPEIRKQAFKALERGESATDVFFRLLTEHVRPPAGAGKKPPRMRPPEQESLF